MNGSQAVIISTSCNALCIPASSAHVIEKNNKRVLSTFCFDTAMGLTPWDTLPSVAIWMCDYTGWSDETVEPVGWLTEKNLLSFI